MKTKIAFYLPAFLNFSETFIYKLTTGIKKYEVVILCRERKNTDTFVFKNVIVIKNRKHLAAVLKLENIKLIHAQFGTYGAEIVNLAARLKIPLITHFRGQDAYQLSRKFFIRLSYKNLFKKGTLFLTVSAQMRDYLMLLGCPAEKIKVYYGGIDLRNFKFKPRNFKPKQTYKVLLCGRLVEKKGYDLGLKAIAYSGYNVETIIIGEGPEKNALLKLAEELKIKVYFTGSLNYEKVKKYLGQADLLLAPYLQAKNGDSEGIPNILKEAMAVGLPVLTTRHSGIAELVDRNTGFLAEENNLDSLLENLRQVLKNYPTCQKKCTQARLRVEEDFNLQKQLSRLELIYQSLLKE